MDRLSMISKNAQATGPRMWRQMPRSCHDKKRGWTYIMDCAAKTASQNCRLNTENEILKMTEKNSCFAAHGSMSRRDGRDGDRRRNCLELSGRKTLRATASMHVDLLIAI
jgi:hypothetical protein